MAKLVKNIIWKGKYCTAGSEAPEGVPASVTDGDPVETHQRVVRKTTTKRKKRKTENKNAAPKTDDK